MATVVIQKRKGKKGMSYAIRYANPLTGKKKYYKTFKKQKEAQRAANDLRALLDSGKKPENTMKKFNPLTFEEVADSLRADWELRLKRNDLKQKTYDEYCIWLNVLGRTFGKRMLCQITSGEIEAYRDKKASDHSNITANKYLSMMRKMFNCGLILHAVIDNPSRTVGFLSEKSHERNRFLFPHELDKLIEATQKLRAKFYLPAIIYLGAEHGAAKQELLSLEWSDIDFDYSQKGFIKLFRTKNERERSGFLMPRTRKALLGWRDHLRWKRHRERIAETKSDRVFCRIDGTPIKCFDKAWRQALKLAGIEDFHFHDLRHTFCSNLILSGAGLKEAKEMIGHQDISMTDRYAHLSLDHTLIKQVQLAEHYSSGTSPQSSMPD